MEGDQSERLLFRMQHIIPRTLAATPGQTTIASMAKSATANGPEEFTYQMTYGKVAGTGSFAFEI